MGMTDVGSRDVVHIGHNLPNVARPCPDSIKRRYNRSIQFVPLHFALQDSPGIAQAHLIKTQIYQIDTVSPIYLYSGPALPVVFFVDRRWGGRETEGGRGGAEREEGREERREEILYRPSTFVHPFQEVQITSWSTLFMQSSYYVHLRLYLRINTHGYTYVDVIRV